MKNKKIISLLFTTFFLFGCEDAGYGVGVKRGSSAVALGELSLGRDFSCYKTSTGSMKCWGSNANGQLGDGTTTDSVTPIDVSGLAGTVSKISLGNAHSCALLSSGTVQCWGENSNGTLGNGSTTASSSPVNVQGLGGSPTAISAGASHNCALFSDGTVKCWGDNLKGQLGDGSNTDRTSAVSVAGLGGTATKIAAGYSSTCALLSTGTVRCWGNNSFGELGNGNTTDTTSPVTANIGGTATDLIASSFSTCALLSTGVLKCWGTNGGAQVGNGTVGGNISTPTTVLNLTGSVSKPARSGGSFNCALMSNASVNCWGTNTNGQIGDGTTTTRSSAVAVQGLSGSVSQLELGYDHACSLLTTGKIECWGRNHKGQLGDGTTTDSSAPVEVQL